MQITETTPAPVLRRDAMLRAKSYDKDTRTATFVLSTATVDRYGTLLRGTWKLDNFNRNPVALRQHDPNRIIGRWLVRSEGDELIGDITFAQGTQDAADAETLVEQDMLRAASVAFVPGRSSWVEPTDGSPGYVLYEDCELYEASLVAVGGNADALKRALETEATIKREAMSRAEGKPMPTEKTKDETRSQDGAPATAIGLPLPEMITRAEHDAVLSAMRRDLNDANAKLATERAAREALEATQKKLETARRETKLQSFVGTKLNEGNLEKYRSMIHENEPFFDSVIGDLADLGIGKPGERAMAAEKPAVRATTGVTAEASETWINTRTEERMKSFGESKVVAMRAAMSEAETKGLLA